MHTIKLLILSLFLTSSAHAQLVCNGSDTLIDTTVNGDIDCQTSWGVYTIPSQQTLDAEDIVSQQIQAQQKAIAQQKQINDQAQQEVLADTIANDPTLNAEQAAIPNNPDIPQKPQPVATPPVSSQVNAI